MVIFLGISPVALAIVEAHIRRPGAADSIAAWHFDRRSLHIYIEINVRDRQVEDFELLCLRVLD